MLPANEDYVRVERQKHALPAVSVSCAQEDSDTAHLELARELHGGPLRHSVGTAALHDAVVPAPDAVPHRAECAVPLGVHLRRARAHIPQGRALCVAETCKRDPSAKRGRSST